MVWKAQTKVGIGYHAGESVTTKVCADKKDFTCVDGAKADAKAGTCADGKDIKCADGTTKDKLVDKKDDGKTFVVYWLCPGKRDSDFAKHN